MLHSKSVAVIEPKKRKSAAELVVIRGLPGSGKSTLAKTLALVGFEHFEADMYFMHKGVYEFKSSSLGHAHAWCRNAVDEALERGARVVVANTFTRIAELSDYILTASYFGIPLRIIEATGDFGSSHDVPAEKLQAMRDRWEEITPENIHPDRFMLKTVR